MITSFRPLQDQIEAVSARFGQDATSVMHDLVRDVERACAQRLEIFPVCHHSPSSAVQMVRRLHTRPPRVIYMEACEDLRPLLEGLKDCKLPVALQAFAAEAPDFPTAWSPLNLVCPLSEFSAEFQAISYALTHPETELVFVDRSADHVFQWLPQEDEGLSEVVPENPDEGDDEAAMHGSAVGVEIGTLRPTFAEFTHFLLQNARVRHFSEWWDLYVEEGLLGACGATYRQVMFLIGSLFRRLGSTSRELNVDEMRERYMWTRMKEHLQASKIAPEDALYICGAAHSASYVEEFGIESDAVWEIPKRSSTKWLYGLLPSSYSALEHQFAHPRGAVTLAEQRWKTTLKAQKLKPFSLEKKLPSSGVVEIPSSHQPLLDFLQTPPVAGEGESDELMTRCVRLVQLARRNGYLSSTADAIAIYQTSILLANLRNRKAPTPYDFRDAAVTCVEKDVVPGKRDVAHLCNIILGGDKIGRVGYESMPPLARDVHDRLAPLPINLEARTIGRVLIDFNKNPEFRPCSDLLWKLRYLLPQDVARPIMGQKELGFVPTQESWDVAIGRYQGALLQLAHEGVTVEHVLERRLKKEAFGEGARTVDALRAAEDSLLFLQSERLSEELGERARCLLVQESNTDQAQQITTRVKSLVHYFRSTPDGLPGWIERFVTTGYSHYSTLLPQAFADQGTNPEDLAAMLGFILNLESLALSLGCQRSQLVIAITQAGSSTTDHTKLALLWSTECVVGLRTLTELKSEFEDLLDNELALAALPDYLSGFLLALSFTPVIGSFTVELLSKAFERLPDRVLIGWLPKLLRMVRSHADTALPGLLAEASALFPGTLAELDRWTPPWYRETKPVVVAQVGAASAGRLAGFLVDHGQTTEAVAELLGLDVSWKEVPRDSQVASLVREYPATMEALADLA